MTSLERAWQRARRARDRRFDGRFFVGVTSTGIYCRPICPAPSPHEAHVRYFLTAAAAADAGFRPCLRCRPETAPGSPAWLGTPATVQRALRLIEEQAVDGLRIDDLAERLGIGPRHLHRLFVQHLGAPPHAVVQTRRLHFAKQLVDRTLLPFTTIALASGFGSIRRFNAAVQNTWQRTPTALRRASTDRGSHAAAYRFRLGYRPPYDWAAVLGFLERRAIPGVEDASQEEYRRAIEIDGSAGTVHVTHAARAHAIDVVVRIGEPRALYRIVARVRDMFDLDADPALIARNLRTDARLAPLVRARPGLRVPGTWDGFELAVRAIVGQQASVAGARALCARLVNGFGSAVVVDTREWRLFPRAETLAEAPLEQHGLTRQRAAAIRALAALVASGTLDLGRGSDPEATREALMAVPGIGRWTTEYIAMRALRDPDAFLEGDLVVRRVAGSQGRSLLEAAEAWRPWRAYAVVHFWMGASHDQFVRVLDDGQPDRPAASRRTRRGIVRRSVPARPHAG
jgi:AraC family transcriptional regulator, regulatory protein of adaptative response / DNA-3-methyladenine glycosylase II